MGQHEQLVTATQHGGQLTITQTAPASATGELPAVPPARRVLLIEDNRDAADSLRMLLTLLGHEVRVAYAGPEGVLMAFEWTPDVVLSDLGLPGFDGFEVARRLRRLPGLENTLLVAVTGYGSTEDRRRSREAGFDYHLTKPADPDELLRVMAGR